MRRNNFQARRPSRWIWEFAPVVEETFSEPTCDTDEIVSGGDNPGHRRSHMVPSICYGLSWLRVVVLSCCRCVRAIVVLSCRRVVAFVFDL
jgi:hypothetical protein